MGADGKELGGDAAGARFYRLMESLRARGAWIARIESVISEGFLRMAIRAQRTDVILRPDASRVFFRPFDLKNKGRTARIVERVTSLDPASAEREARIMLEHFASRHQRLERFLLKRFDEVKEHTDCSDCLSEAQRMLIGGYFTLEYSLEAAALFNPSVVPHPDQTNLPEGTLRIVLSLRATGEGHISSIVFRTGTVDADGRIEINHPTRFVTAADVHPNPSYNKTLFRRKVRELGALSPEALDLLNQLEEQFTFNDLAAIARNGSRRDADNLLALARANYEISFEPESRYSERVIFPVTPAESRGIEDARFVQFFDEDGRAKYYATYTAFDGQVTLPQMLETEDFTRFAIGTLNGPEVQNKGMALFPRKIGGRYAMLSRQDGENIFLMYSDMLHFWYEREVLLEPEEPWEFVQLGNCGSPIETSEGWLVLTHGVGAMRRYTIGAILLDLEDPSRVIGRLREPLLEPAPDEREGYVPNVVYSCGGLIHAGLLILPYARSDQSASFATVPLEDLLEELKCSQPNHSR
jgi:predicted GH43/DUF377 family glycosyl hydrolase